MARKVCRACLASPGGSFLPAASDAGPESKDSSGSQKSRPRKLPAPGQEPQQNQPCQSKAQAGQKKALSSGSRFSSLGQRRQLAADFLPGRRSVQALQGRGGAVGFCGTGDSMEPSSSRASKASRSPRHWASRRSARARSGLPWHWTLARSSSIRAVFFLSALLLLPAPAFCRFSWRSRASWWAFRAAFLLFQLPDACAQSSGLGFQSVQGLELLPAAG